MNTTSSSYKRLRSLSLWAMLLTFILIVVGATVRVFDAGMSCPDWPKCYGMWWPFPVPAGTEYSNFEVFLEWVHRLIAMVVGFIMIAIFVISLKLRKEFPRYFKLTIAALLLLATQVKMGAVTVWLSNINWSVALHLGNAMLFLSAVILLRMAASRSVDSVGLEASTKFKVSLYALAVSVFVTMIMGAMVSSSYAGGICGGLLSCQGTWLPELMTERLHMSHRLFAFITLALAVVVMILGKKEGEVFAKSAKRLKMMVGAQVLIGIITLYSFDYYAEYYQFLSVFHLAWGTLVYVIATTTIAKLYIGPKELDSKYFPGH